MKILFNKRLAHILGMVDTLLDQFDANEDGMLDYLEFMKSFIEARNQLGLF